MIEATPDITLAELRERMIAERGETFAISTIHDSLPPPRRDIQKKTAHASEQEREDVKARRRAWVDLQSDLDPAKLVFLDETGATTKMARPARAQPAGRALPRRRSPMAIGRRRRSSRRCASTA